MFVLGVAVTFSGVLQRDRRGRPAATLLTFVLPACTPPGPDPRAPAGLGDRAGGRGARRAVPAAAAPPRRAAQARRRRCAARWPTGSRAAPSAPSVTTAMDALRANFLGADFRPVGLTAGSRALVRVVDDLQWLSDRDHRRPPASCLAQMQAPVVRVLRDSAAVLRDTNVGGPRTRTAPTWRAALTEQRVVAQSRYRDDIIEILGEDDDAAAIAVGRRLLTAPHDIGGRRCHRPGHRRRRGRRRAAGVGAGAWPSAARHRVPPTGCCRSPSRGRPIDDGFRRHPRGRGAQQPAHRPRAGARGRGHPRVPGASTASGWCSARCRCCAAAR